MMTAEEVRALGERLHQNLLLRYSPIAMKLLYDESEIPEGSQRPLKDNGHHLAMCQAYAAVRRDRVSLTMLKEDHWCVWPLVSFGLVDLDADDYAYMGDKFFFRDKERSRKFLREEYPFLKAEKKPVGFALAPLENANFVPDLVTIYCNPAQIRALLMGTKFMTGEMFPVTLDPVDSCVHSSIPVLNGLDYNITFPDPGEYERGLTDEDEVMFTLKGEKLPEVAEGVEIISRAGFGYKQLSMEMTKDFPRPEFYNKMFEKWGLDTGALWSKQTERGEQTMTVQEFNARGKRLEELLRLRSHPVAVKWLEKEADIPAGAIVPTRDLGKHMALCQAFTYARMKGKTIAMTKGDHWCWNPLIGYGLVECVPGQPQFDEVCTYIGIPDRKKAEDFFARFPRLPLGKYEAVLVAPLTECGFEPDVITVYGTPYQINYACRCIKSVLGDSFPSVFDGIDSCIYCTVPTFREGVFRVTFPDPGEYERARARDDEVILSVPPAKLDALMEAIEWLSSFMPANDALVEIPLDFPRPPFYNKLYELWGLEKGEDWALGDHGKNSGKT